MDLWFNFFRTDFMLWSSLLLKEEKMPEVSKMRLKPEHGKIQHRPLDRVKNDGG